MTNFIKGQILYCVLFYVGFFLHPALQWILNYKTLQETSYLAPLFKASCKNIWVLTSR